MVIYKRDRITIGDERNRDRYLEKNPICECCGKRVGFVHHIIPQQYRYMGEVYIIDLAWNYFTLGTWCCHGVIEHNESQYNREFLGKVTKKPWSYWHTPKDGINADEFIANWLAEQKEEVGL